MRAYEVLRPPRYETRRVRGLAMRLRRWGPEGAPVLLLHGLGDTGDTFQFMVDAFERDLPLVALDWRGFGDSAWPQDGYWFPDYLADLDALLDGLGGEPVHLIGHSMGGNIAMLYAGLKPQRVRSLVNLEGFGLPRVSAEQAPERLRKWLDQVKSAPPVSSYGSFEELAALIRTRYPRVPEAEALFIAHVWARSGEGGRVFLKSDPRHRWVNPVLYRREEAEACWREVRAPVLMLLGEDSEYLGQLKEDGTEEAWRALIPSMQVVRIAGAGHMLHIEQPRAVASAVERFLGAR